MTPSEKYSEDVGNLLVQISLLISSVFQVICLCLCMMIPDEQCEPNQYEKLYTDSDECSSEQSSPGHRVILRARRHDKKKRR